MQNLFPRDVVNMILIFKTFHEDNVEQMLSDLFFILEDEAL